MNPLAGRVGDPTTSRTASESLYPDLAEWTSNCEQLRQANTLPELVWLGLQLGLIFARLAVEEELKH